MIIPAGFAQANLRFTGDVIPRGAEVTFGLDVALSPLDPSEVGLLIRGHLITQGINVNWVNNVTLSSILVKFGPNATGPSAITPAAITGTKTADVAPGNTALLFNRNTAFGGRAGKGRGYWPGQSIEDLTDNNTWLTGLVTSMQDDLEGFRAKMEADDIGLVLLHGPNSPLTVPTPITSLTVQSLAATQRRRMRR